MAGLTVPRIRPRMESLSVKSFLNKSNRALQSYSSLIKSAVFEVTTSGDLNTLQ